MQQSKFIFTCLIAASLCLSAAAAPQPKPKGKTIVKPATTLKAADGREVRISSDKLDYDEAKKKVRLIGKVRIVSEKMVMTSPYAEFFTDKKIGDFEGGVKMTGPGSSAVGRQMRVWYQDKRALLKGNVHLISEKGPGAQPGSPSTLDCDELDYFWEKGVGKARGRVKVLQGNRRAFGDRAIYNKAEQTVVLEGNVRVERGVGDWMSAERASMDLAAGTMVAEGSVLIRTKTDPEKKDGAASEEPKSQAKPVPIEPDYPIKPVEAPPEIRLPGLDR